MYIYCFLKTKVEEINQAKNFLQKKNRVICFITNKKEENKIIIQKSIRKKRKIFI